MEKFGFLYAGYYCIQEFKFVDKVNVFMTCQIVLQEKNAARSGLNCSQMHFMWN